MQTRGSILNWSLSLAESISFAATVVIVVLWVMATFQSKDSAQDVKKDFEVRLSKVENDLISLRHEISDVAKDTQYIRGRLEPKVGEK